LHKKGVRSQESGEGRREKKVRRKESGVRRREKGEES
jgi:hypothetical protein